MNTPNRRLLCDKSFLSRLAVKPRASTPSPVPVSHRLPRPVHHPAEPDHRPPRKILVVSSGPRGPPGPVTPVDPPKHFTPRRP